MEQLPTLSDRAVDCFAHGLSHLICELGTEKGLLAGTEILERLREHDFAEILHQGELSAVGAGTPFTERTTYVH